jgi:CheY-like chemotaxis protein
MKPTLLLVDDDPAIRSLIALSLRNHGYEVVEAADGEDAMGRARDLPNIAAVVSDICMPNLNGFALADAVREIHPNVRFVFMSGYPVDKSRLKSNSQFLCKPFHPSSLLSALASASQAA